MINLKKYAIMILMVVSLVLTATTVLADSPDYDIVDVEVNDISLGASKVLNIDRTDSITVDVELISKSSSVTPDVRVKASIEGYEFGDIEGKSDIFDLEPNNITYKKTFQLEIPEDLQASQQYTLRIEVSDPRNQEIREVKLNINEQRHYLRIFDVLLRPQGSIEAGKPLFASIRVENLGEKKERDIEVRVSVPQLGIIARDYIDELVNEFDERITIRDDEESSASSNELMLRIPEDAKTGVYDLLVEVIYNRGHSKVTQRIPLNVVGGKVVTAEPQIPITETTIVSIDSTSKTIKSGEEIPFKIMFANMDNIQRIYNVEVSGTQLFADARVDPGFVTVQGGRTGEAYVFLKVKPNAESKKQFFTIRALSGTNTIKEFSLTVDVKGKEAVSWAWLKNLLYWIFGILIVAFVVLSIIWGVKRSGQNDEAVRKDEGRPLEPSPSVTEGQSYYYYPKQ